MLSPAKINWYLRVAGKRSDGFHEIASIVSLLNFGDELTIETSAQDSFESNHLEITDDSGNLIIQARDLYREATGYAQPVAIRLDKQIPLGSGFGGGSSNASTTLIALNNLNNRALEAQSLMQLSAQIGSDCPLFFNAGFSIIRGRGEMVEPIQIPASEVLSQKHICLMHPGFPISAAWAYQTLAMDARSYTPEHQIKKELLDWKNNPSSYQAGIKNDLSKSVFHKYVSLPTLIDFVYEQTGIRIYMSGSGSGCFATLDNFEGIESLKECVQQCWGHCFFEICNILEANGI